MKDNNPIKRFYNFLKKDTWPSFLVTLILAFIIIKFIFFPVLSYLTGSPLPLVIVESCSMHHYEKGFSKIFETSNIYGKYDVKLEDTSNWDFQNGFNKGDVIFVVGPKNAKVGDVIIFNGGSSHPLIHRLIKVDDTFSTKGDNYLTNSEQLPSEKKINKEQIIGKALFRVPAIGWIKLIFFEASRPQSARGLC